MPSKPASSNPLQGARLLRAIVSDVQFWIPAVVLLLGVLLLITLHN